MGAGTSASTSSYVTAARSISAYDDFSGTRILLHPARFFFRASLLLAFPGVSVDVGVMSAAILDIEEDMLLTAFQAEVLVGSLNLIAAFGGLIAGTSGVPRALVGGGRCM